MFQHTLGIAQQLPGMSACKASEGSIWGGD
jgi:hypothetical protein